MCVYFIFVAICFGFRLAKNCRPVLKGNLMRSVIINRLIDNLHMFVLSVGHQRLGICSRVELIVHKLTRNTYYDLVVYSHSFFFLYFIVRGKHIQSH